MAKIKIDLVLKDNTVIQKSIQMDIFEKIQDANEFINYYKTDEIFTARMENILNKNKDLKITSYYINSILHNGQEYEVELDFDKQVIFL